MQQQSAKKIIWRSVPTPLDILISLERDFPIHKKNISWIKQYPCFDKSLICSQIENHLCVLKDIFPCCRPIETVKYSNIWQNIQTRWKVTKHTWFLQHSNHVNEDSNWNLASEKRKFFLLPAGLKSHFPSLAFEIRIFSCLTKCQSWVRSNLKS